MKLRPFCHGLLLSFAIITLVYAAPLPPDSEYVTVKEGHLSVNGRRERYWAVIGKPYISAGVTEKDTPAERQTKIANSRRGTDLLVQRFTDLGFNACRFWDALPNTENYTVGDGSRADCADYFLSEMKKRGNKIWIAGLNRAGVAKPGDVDIIDDPATAEAWKQAVSESKDGGISLRGSASRTWDPRLEALHIRSMKEIATHTNKHTGLRWCDDPVIGVWELTNEEWWVRRMLGGAWQKEPAFFRNELIAQWNGWLRKKYDTEEKLKAAWGKLLPGESLANASVLFAPMAGKTSAAISMNDANEQARQALEGLQQQYSRADFAPARASDVIAFLVEVQMGHKQREAAALKSWGRSTQLCPLVYDTGIGYEIQSQYMHQQADAVAHDAYVNGWGPEYKEPDLSQAKTETQKMLMQIDAERISANEGPWVNWLLKPPGISQGVPWLEQNKVEGRPFFVYETQIQQPAKYRADFPLRLAALASIQDWDWIAWHYFSPGDDVATAGRPFDKPMDITVGQHPQGYHFTFDEVQNSMMRAAAFIFREDLLKPAPNPTKFIYGRKSLYDPASMDYAGSYGPAGMDMLQTTYQYGVRIEIDPNRENDEVIGPVVTFAERKTHNPYTPTDQIVFDWKKGYLSMDAPSAVAWAGQIAKNGGRVEFKNGVTLSDVRIKNPAGIFEPIGDDEKYIAFALHSLDGKPLSESKSASISLMSTSFNTGFQLGSKANEPNKPPVGATGGGLPVLVARVGATVESPALNGMRYTFRDWHMKEIGGGVVKNGILVIPADQPVFTVELTRPDRPVGSP